MKKFKIGDYTLVPYRDLSYEEWLDIRNSFGLALGGSDMSVIMGVNEYASLPMLFDQKLGLIGKADLSRNKSVFWGNRMENIVRESSQYYDLNDKDSYLSNFTERKKIRNHIAFDYTIQNDNLPFMFANVDGISIDDEESNVIHDIEVNGVLPTPKSIIEVKTMNRHVYDKWGNESDGTKGLPIGYIYQVLAYMTQYLYMNPNIDAHIFSLVAGIDLHAYRIEFNQEIVDEMLNRAYEFYLTLQQGQDIINNSSNDKQMKLGLDEIRPEADASENYQQYINENYLKRLDIESRALGTEEMLEVAEKYVELNSQISTLTKEKTKYGNKAREFLNRMNASHIDLPNNSGVIKYNNRLIIKVK
jgi:predicted phage-related endonuclease